MPSVAILGSGAVGALLGGLLHRAGTGVTLVAREGTAAALRRAGLQIDSPRFGTLRSAPDVTERLIQPADALLVAVKAPQLAPALERIASEPAVVVPLLNGIEHVAALRERFGDRVVAGVVRVQAHRETATHVVHRAPFVTVTLAAPGAPALAASLRAAGVDVEDGPDEATVLWGKLARLCGLALATAAADAPLGDVRGDAEAVALEAVAVARAEGADVDAATVAGELRGLPAGASSSLRADVCGGSDDDELDAIAGAVLRAAARHGLAAPRTAELAEAVARRRKAVATGALPG